MLFGRVGISFLDKCVLERKRLEMAVLPQHSYKPPDPCSCQTENSGRAHVLLRPCFLCWTTIAALGNFYRACDFRHALWASLVRAAKVRALRFILEPQLCFAQLRRGNHAVLPVGAFFRSQSSSVECLT